MILHTLSAPPASAAYSQCLRTLAPGDALLLMGEGVYGALRDTEPARQLLAVQAALCVLEADAGAAGVTDRLAEGFTLVDYDGFVTLTEQYARQQAWY